MRLREKLELVRLDYETRSVRVVFLKNYDKLPTPGGLINAKKGDEMELPRWQALMLYNKGVVDVKDKKLDLDTINTYHYREKRRAAANQITPLPLDFYMKAKELVEELNRLIQERPTHMLLKDREILEKNLIELGETRLLKILRLALTSSEGFRDKMTPEEDLIYTSINEITSTWRRRIEEIFKG